MLTSDGCGDVAVIDETGCCPPPMCGNDLCCTFVAFFNLLPSGPMWDYWKAAAISYFETSDDPARCPLLQDPSCPNMVLHAIYCVLKLKVYVHTALWPALRESNPATAVTTLDYHLARLSWEDCYAQHCRAVVGELSPLEVMGECGPIFCPPDYPPELVEAVKKGIATALTRANMGVIKNLCGLNWIIAPLGAELVPVYPVPLPPPPAEPCGSMCAEPVSFLIQSTGEYLPGVGDGELCEQTATPPVLAHWDRECLPPGGLPGGMPLQVWPGVLAAECIVRSMLPPSCPSNIRRAC